MKRLTFEGNFCDLAMCRENPCPYNGSCSQKETWLRLKEYEDREERSQWISVEERLPELGEVIAISPRYQDYLIGYLVEVQEGTGVICVGDGVQLENVTHWMPLPEPPDGGAEG